MNVQLLLVDCQFDFTNKSHGSLYVPGADQDCDRLAMMVSRLKKKIDDIHATVDSHHLFSIFHKNFWVNDSGKNPDDFTMITVDDVEGGKWKPVVPSLSKRSLDYVKGLRAGGKYNLITWPDHCRILTEGQSIEGKVMDALTDWERDQAIVNFVTKGSNPYTECYSALRAEIEDPQDSSTGLNTQLLGALSSCDVLAIAGEAKSHCLKSTVEDIASSFGDENIKKLVLLTDCTSSVAGFEKQGDEFVKNMVARGMKLSTSKDFLA